MYHNIFKEKIILTKVKFNACWDIDSQKTWDVYTIIMNILPIFDRNMYVFGCGEERMNEESKKINLNSEIPIRGLT